MGTNYHYHSSNMETTKMNPPLKSKINYLALIIALVNMVALAGYIPQEYVVHILSVVNTVGPGLIMIFRTWFNEKKAA